MDCLLRCLCSLSLSGPPSQASMSSMNDPLISEADSQSHSDETSSTETQDKESEAEQAATSAIENGQLGAWDISQEEGTTSSVTSNMEAHQIVSENTRAPPPQIGTSFTPFRHLSPELRIKIWELLLPEPRSLTPHPDYVCDDKHGPSALSPLFDVCFESKEIIAKIYPLCFEGQLLGKPIRFSPVRDTIVFPNYSTMKHFLPYSWFSIPRFTRSEKPAYELVRHLVLRYEVVLGAMLPFAQHFQNLETLVIEAKVEWDPAYTRTIDEAGFVDRLRQLAWNRGKDASLPLITFRNTGQ